MVHERQSALICTDTGRLFVVGYSDGSWLTNQLTCIWAMSTRAAGPCAGRRIFPGHVQRGGWRTCSFTIKNDNDNVIAGSERARDRLLMQNGCDRAASKGPSRKEPSPCVRYQGCAAGLSGRLVHQTSGKGHDQQDSLAHRPRSGTSSRVLSAQISAAPVRNERTGVAAIRAGRRRAEQLPITASRWPAGAKATSDGCPKLSPAMVGSMRPTPRTHL